MISIAAVGAIFMAPVSLRQDILCSWFSMVLLVLCVTPGHHTVVLPPRCATNVPPLVSDQKVL